MLLFICLLFGLCLTVPSLEAGDLSGDHWRSEICFGDAVCLPAPLHIEQTGYPDIDMTARYAARSFEMPLYYSLRIAYQKNRRAWELEIIHLKLHLKNGPPEIQEFSISHGYNLCYINRIFPLHLFDFRAGAGIVIAHAENRIRGRKLDEYRGFLKVGYYFAGPSVQISLGRTLRIISAFYLNIEGKFTAAFGTVPVVDGRARVIHAGLHGVIGMGYRF